MPGSTARKQAEEALAKWDHDPDFTADNCIPAILALLAATREQEAEHAMFLRMHDDCDAIRRSLVSQGLAAIRRAEEAEAALAEERRKREEAERERHAALVMLGVAVPVAPAPQPEAGEKRADAMGRLIKSFETAEELRRWTHAEIADLLSEHWMEIDGLSAASDLVAEVLDRLRGLKTCADCAGYGYLDHVRCATCEGTGDVPRPAPPAGDGAREAAELVRNVLPLLRTTRKNAADATRVRYDELDESFRAALSEHGTVTLRMISNVARLLAALDKQGDTR